jgi:peptide chain release factor subunit 1
MAQIDREFLKSLAQWNANGLPVSSLYLDVDGKRHPRRQDFGARAEQICHQLKRDAEGLGRDGSGSVAKDARTMLDFLGDLDRGNTRGVALFASSRAGLWEEVLVPRPLRDRGVVASRPYVMPLEALIETYESFCTVLVDRARARIFLTRMGSIEEETDVLDEVPGRHDQGGWSQSRYQRHIDDIAAKHLKHAADVLLRFYKRTSFDHLIIGGPEEIVPEFERGLHDYLKRTIAARIALSVAASPQEVLERSMAVEERIEAERERKVRERLIAGASAGGQAVTGLPRVLDALNEGRVETLVVPFGISAEGVHCGSCGRLAMRGQRCPTCGGPMEAVHDLVESAVAAALRQRSRLETLPLTTANGEGEAEIGALLRF